MLVLHNFTDTGKGSGMLFSFKHCPCFFYRADEKLPLLPPCASVTDLIYFFCLFCLFCYWTNAWVLFVLQGKTCVGLLPCWAIIYLQLDCSSAMPFRKFRMKFLVFFVLIMLLCLHFFSIYALMFLIFLCFPCVVSLNWTKLANCNQLLSSMSF